MDFSKRAGFTLIELIVVIIILGILAVSVFTRFDGTSGYAEYTYQARLISSLRNMQQRAMQDTRKDFCFQINFSSSPVAFGPPSLSYNPGDATATCSTSIDHSNPDYLSTSASEMSDEGVVFGSLPFNFIGFDSLGRPLTENIASPNCGSGCQVDFVAQETVSVCIESEGYIHVC
ncbi:MAG: MSHA pilin protein MshC [Paraglaciecola sp.]